MSAAERLAALDEIAPAELCARTGDVLQRLVEIMNAETMLLRAHRYRQAGELTADKTQLAQDYVSLTRAAQRRLPRLKEEAPEAIEQLRRGHESLATQMAENLRVIATARNVTETLLTDVSQEVAEKGKAGIGKALDKLVSRDKLAAADAKTVLQRITPVGDYAPMAEAGLIIEAATEREEVKRTIFARVGEVLGHQAVLASNTSSIPITRLAQSSPDPKRFVGVHFFNPVPMMKCSRKPSAESTPQV